MKSISVHRFTLLFSAVAVFIFLFSACGKKSPEGAHTLVLKDGTVLKGQLVSRSETAIKFEINGETREIPIEGVYSLTLKEGEAPVYLASEGGAQQTPQTPMAAPQQPASTPKPAPAQKPAAAPAQKEAPGSPQAASTPPQSTAQQSTPPPAPKPVAVTVTAGTKLMIKLTKALSTQTLSTGSLFDAVLETDLMAGGVTVAPKGDKVYGKIIEARGGKRVGGAKLLATFTGIAINNQIVPITTDDVGAEGGKGGAVRKVGAGALIGAAAGDAAAGAAIGGAVALLGGGSHIQVPAGTLVEVNLKQPFTVNK